MTKNTSKIKVPIKKDLIGIGEALPKRKIAADKNRELWDDHTPESLKAVQHLFDLSPIDKLKYEWFIELAHLYRMRTCKIRWACFCPGFTRKSAS